MEIESKPKLIDGRTISNWHALATQAIFQNDQGGSTSASSFFHTSNRLTCQNNHSHKVVVSNACCVHIRKRSCLKCLTRVIFHVLQALLSVGPLIIFFFLGLSLLFVLQNFFGLSYRTLKNKNLKLNILWLAISTNFVLLESYTFGIDLAL